MKKQDNWFELHSFYNLTRYLFLKIEYNYNKIVEKSGITLPQLRVLWVISAFPGISPSKIAKIICCTRPTVTNIIKILMDKNLILRYENTNKKTKKLNLTELGEYYIKLNRQKKQDKFPLNELLNSISAKDLQFLINILKHIIIEVDNEFIFEYIEKINSLSLKIDYEDFEETEQYFLKNLVVLYNLLRILVLTIENTHSVLLKTLNLTYPQLRALNIIKAFPGITSFELSQMALWSPSTANLIVRNLYNKNLIYKSKGKIKNSLHIFITEQGESLVSCDFNSNFCKIKILNIVESISNDKLNHTNKILYSLNYKLNNNMLDEYILKTFKRREN